jgi:hypothetical protein
MKLFIAALSVLCLASLSWANWTGTVIWKNQGVGGATVTTNPSGGEDTTPGSGVFNLGIAEGMVNGQYYHWLKGYRSDIGDGYNYVERYYYSDVPVGGLDIYLDTAGK